MTEEQASGAKLGFVSEIGEQVGVFRVAVNEHIVEVGTKRRDAHES